MSTWNVFRTQFGVTDYLIRGSQQSAQTPEEALEKAMSQAPASYPDGAIVMVQDQSKVHKLHVFHIKVPMGLSFRQGFPSQEVKNA